MGMERQEDLNRANFKQFQERQQNMKDKEEYRDLCMINAEREINKEQNYRNVIFLILFSKLIKN